MVHIDNFPIKNGRFIFEFKIRGPKWQNVTTAKNEGNLYIAFLETNSYPLITETKQLKQNILFVFT